MKIIHIADVHCNKERKEQTIHIVDTLIESTKKDSNIKAVLFCGDFWDSTITNTKASGFVDVINKMKELTKIIDVYMIYGTPSHEPDGCLEVFKSVGCIVTDKPCTYIKEYFGETIEVMCIPEPRLTKYKGSLKEKYASVHKMFKTIAEPKSEAFRVVMYHGDIAGAELQNGEKVKDNTYAITKTELNAFNADYIACGHIHKPQMVMDNCYYSGSACPVNFGELHDGSFKIIEL